MVLEWALKDPKINIYLTYIIYIVRRQLKQTLGLTPVQQLEFQPHSDAIKSGSHKEHFFV